MNRTRQRSLNKIISVWKIIYYRFICTLIGILAYPFFVLINARFLNMNVTRIGHFCMEPECFIKEGILGMRKNFHGIILAPYNKVPNIRLLIYWKPYITIITSPLLRILLDPLWHNKLTMYDVQDYTSNILNKSLLYPKIQKAYFGRTPLLSLKELDYQRGWTTLQKLGIPKDAWFVCIHCREQGYDVFEENQAYRSADINNYFLTMEAIVKRGGWIIRMGDPTMKHIPQMHHVIDYAHLDIKSDWMDIFLCASCKFMIGGASGLCQLSKVFDVPVIIVNMAPMPTSLFLGQPCDIGIPKLVWSIKEKRYLNFKEIFNSPVGHFFRDYSYSDAGLKVLDNFPEDIKDVAIEMLNRLEGTALYSDKDVQLQKRFKSLLNSNHCSYESNSRIGQDFLQKYEYLFND